MPRPYPWLASRVCKHPLCAGVLPEACLEPAHGRRPVPAVQSLCTDNARWCSRAGNIFSPRPARSTRAARNRAKSQELCCSEAPTVVLQRCAPCALTGRFGSILGCEHLLLPRLDRSRALKGMCRHADLRLALRRSLRTIRNRWWHTLLISRTCGTRPDVAMLPRVQIESRVAALGIPQLVDVRDQQRSTVRRRGAIAGGWGRTGIHVTSGGTVVRVGMVILRRSLRTKSTILRVIRLSIAGWSGRGPSLTPYVTFTPCRLDLTRGFAMVRGWCAFLDQFWHTHPGGWGGAGGACKGALSCGWGVRWVRWVRRAVGV